MVENIYVYVHYWTGEMDSDGNYSTVRFLKPYRDLVKKCTGFGGNGRCAELPKTEYH